MRSNIYDTLEVSINRLKKQMSNHENALEKADIKNINTLHNCIDAYEDVNLLCKAVYAQFEALKRDYNTGLINLAWYKDNLSKFKDLFTGDKKITNVNLHPEEIASELKKFYN